MKEKTLAVVNIYSYQVVWPEPDVIEMKWYIEVNPEHASLEELRLLEALMVTVCGSHRKGPAAFIHIGTASEHKRTEKSHDRRTHAQKHTKTISHSTLNELSAALIICSSMTYKCN